MTTNKLCNFLQRFHLPLRGVVAPKYSTAVHQQNSLSNKIEFDPSLFKINKKICEPNLSLASLSINSHDFDLPTHRGWINNVIDSPIKKIYDITDPAKNDYSKEDKTTDKTIDLPTNNSSINIEKQAARMIVIRRRKMRRHKLKKLRKKMKFKWAKVKQRRELKKEKAFHAELLAQIHEAEKFDAKKYVQSKFDILDNVRIPSRWKGEILPESMIREFMQKEEEIKQRKLNIPRLKLD
ncbi:hypothetical protein HCN44_006793 [Aphidius gifuensis]|uniref:Ribosomal protein mS38 C-terminal domain-containing protein n=1 Tax=Aphidius gifuensis TaxID=684658 RepID=A0A834Y376_APHGI|nr:uncharacterized protein LOC122849858 [Aphidius gifuensis]KAF7995686.1 hypothetical protein HCN44_006793 [Aphidius gifuensis]